MVLAGRRVPLFVPVVFVYLFLPEYVAMQLRDELNGTG